MLTKSPQSVCSFLAINNLLVTTEIFKVFTALLWLNSSESDISNLDIAKEVLDSKDGCILCLPNTKPILLKKDIIIECLDVTDLNGESLCKESSNPYYFSYDDSSMFMALITYKGDLSGYIDATSKQKKQGLSVIRTCSTIPALEEYTKPSTLSVYFDAVSIVSKESILK